MPIVTLDSGDVRDEIRQMQYDSYRLMPGEFLPGVRRFFATLSNPDQSPKSILMTNQTQAGLLPVATSFRIQGMAFDAQSEGAPNIGILPTVVAKTSLNLLLGVKNYWTGPTRFAAGRMQNTYAAGTAADYIHQQMGEAAVQPLVFQGFHVIDLPSQQNFQVQWACERSDLTDVQAALTPAAGSDVLFCLSLKGILRRPVQ